MYTSYNLIHSDNVDYCYVFMSIFHLFASLQNRFEALSTGSRDKFGGLHSNAADSEQTISQIKYGENT